MATQTNKQLQAQTNTQMNTQMNTQIDEQRNTQAEKQIDTNTRSEEPILSASQLDKTFPLTKEAADPDKIQHALKKISLTIMPGECVGLVGRSGSGKSTLARIIAGLLPADEGTFSIGGEKVDFHQKESLLSAWQKVQIIFQQPFDSFDPRKTIGWSIKEALESHGRLASTDCPKPQQEISRLLAQVGLSGELKNKYPHEISGGECQRAAIARALAAKPVLLICDEITSALDTVLQRQMTELIASLCQQLQVACLFISHDLGLVRRISHRLLVLDEGQIVESGETVSVLNHPQASETKALLKAEKFLRQT